LPDRRAHRGPNPEDAVSFAPEQWPRLREAVADLSLLLTKGYSQKSALKLIGDHFQLTMRQRMAVMRSACSDASLARRRTTEVAADTLAGRPLLLDGYNVLTSMEAALAGGVLLLARDGCYRDLASMHGTFRKVEETHPAVLLMGEVLAGLGVGVCTWYLDSPVSNSGRLRGMLRDAASTHSWQWEVELVASPDRVLAASPETIATADSVILDRCTRWFNLARYAIGQACPSAPVVDLRG
jgi:hypothetical protein